MIVEFTTVEELHQKLTEGYINELEDYCKSKGYTKEQTELFIKNSLEAEEKNRQAELGE